MLIKSKEAAARTTTSKRHRQKESYPICIAESRGNLRNDIGEILFCLEFPLGRELSQRGWRLFERWLRRYMDSKHTGGTV